MSATDSSRGKTATPFPWLGLIVLSAGVFLSITGETLPAGLLPDMSATLHVDEPQAGLLVSIFAITVVITSTPLTAITRAWPRHGLLVLVLIVLGVSNILAALSPNYGFMVATRVLGGMAHGMFWAVVGAYAGHLVPKEQIGRAVSITVGGGTLAFVFGVPLATAAGHAFGWQMSFAGLGVLTLLGAVLVWRFLPAVAREEATDERARAYADPTVRRRDPSVVAVVLVCVLAGIIMVGHYAFYTYIAPFMITVMGVGSANVGPLLFLYGIAGAVGLFLAGAVLGKRPQAGMIITIVVTGVAVAGLAIFAASAVLGLAAFLLWGLAFGALPPLLQTRLLHASSAAFRDTASALYTTAFNLGIGGGALIGAVVYGAYGVGGVPWVYVAVLVLALILTTITGRLGRRPASSASQTN